LNIPKGFIKIGSFGVDAGLCWIGDPCYILHKDQPPKDIGKDWSDFCDILGDKHEVSGDYQTAEFNYDKGHSGLGLCIQSGSGDGCYDVYIKKGSDGYIQQALIDFVGYPDENEECDDSIEEE